MTRSLLEFVAVVVSGCGVFAGRPAAAQARNGEANSCPMSISTLQQLNGSFEGWGERRSTGPHQLEGLRVYEGHPSEMAALVPDGEEDLGNGLKSSVWHLKTSKYGYWMECAYRATDVVVFRKMGGGGERCELVVNAGRLLNGRPETVRATCRSLDYEAPGKGPARR